MRRRTCRRLVCALLLPSLTLQAVAESHRIGCWGCWTCPFKDGITTGWDIPTQEIDLLRLYFMTDAMQCQRLTIAVNKHFRRFVLKKERILFFIYKSVRRTHQIKFPPSSRVSPTAVPPLHTLREPTASAPRGATLGARIERDISLIMPLRLRGSFATECHAFSYKTSSFDARFSRRLAARVPSANKHIPLISTP